MLKKTHKNMTLSEKAIFHAGGVFNHKFVIMDRRNHNDRYVFKLLPTDRAHLFRPSHVTVTFIRSKDYNGVQGQRGSAVTHCVIRYKKRQYTIDVSPYWMETPTGTKEYFNYYEARKVFEGWESSNPDSQVAFVYPKRKIKWQTRASA